MVFNSQCRFCVVIAGRRFGKTFLAVAKLLSWASKKGLYWYVAPTYRMAKQITWRALKETTPPSAIKKIDETDLSIELLNGAIIALRGADNFDSLRGVSLSGLVMDEFADIKPEAWQFVLRPACADQLAPVLFIGTPKGWNWAKDAYDAGFDDDKPDWASWMFTTADGGNVPESELISARRELPESVFKQEYLASFETLANRVYSYFDRVENVSAVEDLGAELYIGMDFNVAPMSAVVASKVGDQLHVFDEIELMNSNTEEMAQEIINRYAGRKIIVCPDPAGRARKTSAAVGTTDFTILERYGFYVEAPNSHPMVVDRINEVQAMLKNAQDERRLFIHPRCKSLIKCLDGLTYKLGSNQPDKSLGLDHMTDALGYMVHITFPIEQHVTHFKIGFAQ